MNLNKKRKVFMLLLACIFMTGCATVRYYPANDLGKGPTKVYDYPYITVYDAALAVMNDLKVNVQSKDRKSGWIVGVQPANVISDGQYVAIYIQAMDDKVSRVEVLTKRVVAAEVYVGDLSQTIFDGIGKKLESSK